MQRMRSRSQEAPGKLGAGWGGECPLALSFQGLQSQRCHLPFQLHKSMNPFSLELVRAGVSLMAANPFRLNRPLSNFPTDSSEVFPL